jgi:formate/nitrite transporter FocA (FNT family)
VGFSLIPNYKSISSFLWLQIWLILFYYAYNRIGAVMASVLASTAVYSWFESQSDHTKDYKLILDAFRKERSTEEKEPRLFGSKSR